MNIPKEYGPREVNGMINLRCPWHEERTPSCVINTKKEFFHCFGCGKHGPIEEIMKKVSNA
jgi:DNA primase